MSRVGKQKIVIPKGVEIKLVDGSISVTGPLGTVSRLTHPEVKVEVLESEVKLQPASPSPFANVLWGTYASHILNMIAGVTQGFKKKLTVEGVGYKADSSSDTLSLSLGFSHPVKVKIPAGIRVLVEKGVNLAISGCDKEKVGEFAARVRALRPPEPYKGKGIRYDGEVILRKQGKKTVT